MPTLVEWWNRLKRDFKLAMLPHKPGAFRLLDAAGAIIHIGAVDDLALRLPEQFTSRPTATDFQFEAAATIEEAQTVSQRWSATGNASASTAPPSPPAQS